MKVLDILVENENGSIEVRTEFSAKELQTLLQFAVNMSASIGLGVEKTHRAQMEADQQHELND